MITDEAGRPVPFPELVLGYFSDLWKNLTTGEITPAQRDVINASSGPAGVNLQPNSVIPGTGQTVAELKGLGYTDSDIQLLLGSAPSVMASDNAINKVIAENNAAAKADQIWNSAPAAIKDVVKKALPDPPSIPGLTPDQVRLLFLAALALIAVFLLLLIFAR